MINKYSVPIYDTRHQITHIHINQGECRPNCFDVGLTLYKCYTNVFLILDMNVRNKKSGIVFLYLAMRNTKIKLKFAVLDYGHAYIIWSY